MHKVGLWWATLSDGEKLVLFVVAIALIVWAARRIWRAIAA